MPYIRRRTHVDTIFVRKCLDHKVRSIADICIGAHKYSTAGNRRKKLYRNCSQCCCDSVCKSKSSCCCQKYQIGRRIIQETGQSSGRPEHLVRLGDTKIRSYCFQKHQAGCMVIKIPMKSTATSLIAPQVKWFRTRILLSVVLKDRNAAARIRTISMIDGKLKVTSPKI